MYLVGRNPCVDLVCENYATCRVTDDGTATCVCPDSCPPEVSYVCGSDGRNYRNLCVLQSEACEQKNTNLTLAGNQRCGKNLGIFATFTLILQLFWPVVYMKNLCVHKLDKICVTLSMKSLLLFN